MKKKQPTSAITLLPPALILAAGLVFYLAGDGGYRYPCQDPANFTNPSCHPPACLAAEDCTSMLIDLGDTQ
jgi:hypothetical protein